VTVKPRRPETTAGELFPACGPVTIQTPPGQGSTIGVALAFPTKAKVNILNPQIEKRVIGFMIFLPSTSNTKLNV